MIRFSDSRNRR